MRGRGIHLALVGFGLASLVAGAALAQWQNEHPVIRIGMVTGGDPAAKRARTEPFRAYLEERLGADIEIFLSNDYAALISGELTGRFQAAFLTATAFSSATAACGGCIEPIVIPTTANGEEGFHAILVVPAGSSIAGVEGLPGARLAVSAGDSIAGRLLPLALFAEVGIEIDAIELVTAASPAEAIDLMLAGEADAALGWSSMRGAESEGFTRGVLRQMVDEGRIGMADVDIVWTSPLIPHGPLTVRADLPDDLKADLRAAMTELAEVDPDALLAVNGVLGGAYVAAAPELFAPLLLLVGAGR
jgi:phosphonate transport system substrate-binding protein